MGNSSVQRAKGRRLGAPDPGKCLFFQPLAKTKAGRLPGPPGGCCIRENGPVAGAPNYLSGRTERCRAAFPCLAKTRTILASFRWSAACLGGQARGESNILAGSTGPVQAP